MLLSLHSSPMRSIGFRVIFMDSTHVLHRKNNVYCSLTLCMHYHKILSCMVGLEPTWAAVCPSKRVPFSAITHESLWCLRWGSNPHGSLFPDGSEPPMSTNSETRRH